MNTEKSARVSTKYHYGDQIEENKRGRACRMQVDEKCIKHLVGKREGKRPLGRRTQMGG
jgi:hypothetical protein